ncbi:MAG: alpha/beta fold hydrolase [Sciscionella sp.]
MRSSPTYTKGSVTSADGTTIGYRQLGAGPAVILLHGGVNAAQHMMGLGLRLTDAFTVYLPDRRGRGMSGPIGPGYSIEREDEDLAALIQQTGAECVFGPADGGLFALHAAIKLEHVTKVAAYEPLLFAGQEGIEDCRRVFSTMQAKLRAGHSGDALIYSTQETATLAARRGQFPAWIAAALRSIPARPAARLFDLLLRLQPTRDDHVAWRDLLPALVPELDLVKLSEGTLGDYRHLSAEVLLMYGSKSDPVFADTADALHGVLPRSTVIRLPGRNHDSAQTYGKPDGIADVLRLFFSM